MRPTKRPDGIRAVTFNIHGSIGPDRRCDPDRVMAAIRRLDPDILALQEVDGRTHLGRRAEAFEFFAERLGPHLVEARTIPRPGRDHGHILWSRYPIAASRIHVLPGMALERRMAIEAVLETPHGRLHVLAAHLGLLPRGRRTQSAFIAGRAASAEGPCLVMGDLNEWRRNGPVDRQLRNVLPVVLIAPSWPSRRPLIAMDRIYASRDLEAISFFADPETRPVSDHLALVADLVMQA